MYVNVHFFKFVRGEIMDRRQQKTRAAIFEAFTELLAVKSYNKITVQEIIEKANIGRSTFYAHFETRDDLVKALCDDLFQHVFSKALEAEKTHDFSLAGGGYHIILVHILYHLRDSRKNVSALLAGESSLFLKYLKNYFCEYINNYLLPGLHQHKNFLPGDFLLNHITYSFVGLLMWWIKNDWQNPPEEMAQYFEETVLHNAPTYLPFYKEDLDYTLANLNKLVVKDVAEAGGYGVVFGRELTQEKLAELAGMIKREPRRFIAQEVIDFKDLPVMENGVQAERKADLRAFVLTGAETKVWPSGLTRFSREPDSFVVNSSQGGGFKDTWVLSD